MLLIDELGAVRAATSADGELAYNGIRVLYIAIGGVRYNDLVLSGSVLHDV